MLSTTHTHDANQNRRRHRHLTLRHYAAFLAMVHLPLGHPFVGSRVEPSFELAAGYPFALW